MYVKRAAERQGCRYDAERRRRHSHAGAWERGRALAWVYRLLGGAGGADAERRNEGFAWTRC